MKIVIADDKESGRELIRTVLENTGHEVFEAQDGIDALRCIRRHRPDLIILDLHMPGLTGFEVIRTLRADAEFATTPAIALTASAKMGDHQRAFKAGFTGYISKPVHLEVLRAEVARLLG